MRVQAKPIYPSVQFYVAEYDEETRIRGTSESHKLTAMRAIITRKTYCLTATVMREYQVACRVRNSGDADVHVLEAEENAPSRPEYR